MSALLEVVLPVFLVIGFGYLAVWRKLFADAHVDGLMKFTQNYAIPCLLFSAIATLDLGQEFNWAILLSYYTGSASVFFAGMIGARVFFARPWADSVAIGFSALFANSVLLGLPIMERAYGPDSLNGNFAIIAIHAPFCYLLGITTMEIVKADTASPLRLAGLVGRAMFRNALTIGIALGFVVNLTGLVLPMVVWDAVDLMVRAALPAALFGLGGVLYRYRPEGDAKVIAMVCLLGLIVHPLIGWSLAAGPLDLDQEALRSVTITAAMAPGVNSYLFANMYGAARRVAASAVLVGTALSVVTVSAWLIILG